MPIRGLLILIKKRLPGEGNAEAVLLISMKLGQQMSYMDMGEDAREFFFCEVFFSLCLWNSCETRVIIYSRGLIQGNTKGSLAQGCCCEF